jgi:hypothetical protein
MKKNKSRVPSKVSPRTSENIKSGFGSFTEKTYRRFYWSYRKEYLEHKTKNTEHTFSLLNFLKRRNVSTTRELSLRTCIIKMRS